MKIINLNSQKAFRIMLFLALLQFVPKIYAQETTLVGRVSDELGEFMIGVTIQEKGTTNAAITDLNGQYTLKVTSQNPILVASFIGYKDKEVKVGKQQKVVDIILEEDIAELDEVVVVGYGEQRKVSVVGAQSSLKMSDVKVPSASMSAAISGRIAGVVTVQRQGEPGHDGADIWIRGISTFIGQSSSPLVLVDGVERSFSNIDPDDIESFTVLKDASATAVYGVRGANGVVIVKTKPGKVGKPQFSFDYYEGIKNQVRKVKLADAYTYMDAANEAYADTNGGEILFKPDYIEATKKANGLLPNDNPRLYNQYLYPAVDWMDELFKDFAHNRRINASVRGGVPNANYYVSLTYYNESGITRTTKMENYNANMKYDRYNFTSNLNLLPTKRTAIDVGFNGYISEGNYPQRSAEELLGAAMDINPVYLPVTMPDGSVSGISSNGDMRNPLADLNRRGYKNEFRTTLNSNVRVTQDLDFWDWSKGIKATAMVAFDTYNARDLRYDKRESTYYFSGTKDPKTGLWNDDVYDENGEYRYTRTYEGKDELELQDNRPDANRSIYFEASLNYDRSFGLHRIGALALYNQKIYRETKENDMVKTLAYKQQGVAARATYSWNDRYFAEFNLGINGSENFSPDKRFGTFPAFGAGWAVSNEDFWAPIQKYVSYLKIRYTLGWVGSDAVTDRRFMYMTLMGGANNYRFGDWQETGGWAINKYGSNVGWSTSRKQDLGIDIKFLNDNLSLVIDLFKERREDIFLQRKTIPDFAGLTEMPFGNLGIVENKGVELALEFNQQLGKKTFLTVRGNFTWNEDKIIEDDSPAQRYPWLETRGTNVNARRGWIAEGLFTSEEDIKNHAAQFGETKPGDVSKVGDIKYKDLNGDNVIDDNDKCVIGQGDVPKIYYGFGADLQWGNWSIAALFQGTADADRCLDGNSIQPFSSMSGIDNLYDNITDRWSPDDPTNQNVFYPRLHYGEAANTNNNKPSTWWQKDVSFLRLKQLTISYNLPNKLISKAGLSNARIYFMGSNLLTFSSFKLWDPELNTNNGTKYPNNRSFSLGINFGF